MTKSQADHRFAAVPDHKQRSVRKIASPTKLTTKARRTQTKGSKARDRTGFFFAIFVASWLSFAAGNIGIRKLFIVRPKLEVSTTKYQTGESAAWSPRGFEHWQLNIRSLFANWCL
jgi:hypothetical protein